MQTETAFDMLDNVIMGVARRSSTHYQKQAGVHAVVYPFDDGRTQLVTVSHITSWTNRPIVLFYSIFGIFTPQLDFHRMLKTSLRANYSRLCLVKEQYLAIAASLDVEECERAHLFSAIEHRIREVALMADNLEQEFFGVDVY